MSEIKPFTGIGDRVKLSKVLPLDTPFTLNIFPTNICNFRCNYCAQSLGSRVLKEKYDFEPITMKIETIQEVVKQAKVFNRKFKLVSMMGHGEPLCNPRLPEMIKLIKQANIAERIDMITNGSLLTPNVSDSLIEAGIDVIRISLQGMSSKSYKDISGIQIDFEKFIENLTYLYKNKKQCKIYVKTVDTALGENEEELFYETFRNISDRMFIDKIKPVYHGVEYNETALDLSVDRYGQKHERRKVCPQPFYMLSIWANGDVTPCDALYKAGNLGNIFEKQLIEMWNSINHKNFCLQQLKGQRTYNSRCTNCCAPDDVAHKEDILDDVASELIKLYE